ncbi:MAG: hypothetical protein KGI38_12655, partial [Thaumarchaeota archaeon]|nr:hypothetical protein [Nitrososphaerota archaeon]
LAYVLACACRGIEGRQWRRRRGICILTRRRRGMPMILTETVYRFECATCGKSFSSTFKKQFEWNVSQHLETHQRSDLKKTEVSMEQRPRRRLALGTN